MALLGLIVAGFWIFAAINTALNLLLLKSLPLDAPATGPSLSVLIPARNEERAIGATVRSFLQQTYAPLEIIVVDDRSADRTGAILEKLAGEDDRLIVLRGAEPPAGWLGKPWALHQASQRATGELLLFVDADIHYKATAVAAAVAQLRRDQVAMLALLPRFLMKGFWENIVLAQLGMTVFVMLPTWLSNRTRNRRFGIGGGAGNLVSRSAYDSVGGHESLRAAVIDDVGLAALVRSGGHRTRVIRADHLISVRMYEGGREVVEGFTKNLFSVFRHSYAALAAFVLSGIVFSVLPYLLAPTGDIVHAFSLFLITVVRVMTFASLGYPLVYALAGHPIATLVWSWIAFRSAWYTGVKKELRWRGRTYRSTGNRFGTD